MDDKKIDVEFSIVLRAILEKGVIKLPEVNLQPYRNEPLNGLHLGRNGVVYDVAEVPVGEKFEKCELEIENFISKHREEIIGLIKGGLVSDIYFDVGHFVENNKPNTVYRLTATFLKLLASYSIGFEISNYRMD